MHRNLTTISEPLLVHWHICSCEQSPYSVIGELHPSISLQVLVRDATHFEDFSNYSSFSDSSANQSVDNLTLIWKPTWLKSHWPHSVFYGSNITSNRFLWVISYDSYFIIHIKWLILMTRSQSDTSSLGSTGTILKAVPISGFILSQPKPTFKIAHAKSGRKIK